jgi:hypothetical protein
LFEQLKEYQYAMRSVCELKQLQGVWMLLTKDER